MADDKNKNNDPFAAINKQLKDQIAELFQLIWGKHIAGLSVEDLGIMSEDDEETGKTKLYVFCKNGSSNDITYIEDTKRLVIEAIDIYLLLYKQGIKLSKTWLQDVAFPDAKGDYKIALIDEGKIKKDFELSESDLEKVMEKVNKINGLREIFNNEKYSFKKMAALKHVDLKKRFELLKNELVGYEEITDFKEPIYTKAEEGDEENADVPEEVTEPAVTAAKYVDAMADHVADEDYEQKLAETKKKIEDGKNALDKWIESDEEAKNIVFKAVKPIEKFKSQMIPLLWFMGHVGKLKAMFESIFELSNLRNLILEANEGEQEETPKQNPEGGAENTDNTSVANNDAGSNAQEAGGGDKENEDDSENEKKKEELLKKVQSLLAGVEELLKKEKPTEFATAYEQWGKAVTEMFNELAENEKLKEELEKLKDADPYEKLCKLGNILMRKKEEKPEEKKNEPSDGDGAASGEESSPTQETGGNEAKPQTEQFNASYKKVPKGPFLESFRAYLKAAIAE